MNTSTFICASCQNTSFYEDEQGTMCCDSCGIQSQDYIPESQELYEDTARSAREKTFWTDTSKRIKQTKKIKETSLTEFLSTYQYCLKLMTNAIPTYSERLLPQVQHLWFSYLEKWMYSERPLSMKKSTTTPPYYDFWELPDSDRKKRKLHTCTLKTNKTSSSSHKEDNDDNQLIRGSQDLELEVDFDKTDRHPLLPSKPLLLGFIYLASRLLRLPILSSDLLRWCYQGILPYFNLFSHIHVSYKSYLIGEYKTIFMNTATSYKISTNNISFHAITISQSLSLHIPRWNTPHIAYHIIQQLGWPSKIWKTYVHTSNIYQKSTCIPSLDPCQQKYIERIMAHLIVCYKMNSGWMTWSLKKRNPSSKNRVFQSQDISTPSNKKKRKLTLLSVENGSVIDTDRVKTPFSSIQNQALSEVMSDDRLINIPATLQELMSVPRKCLSSLLYTIRQSITRSTLIDELDDTNIYNKSIDLFYKKYGFEYYIYGHNLSSLMMTDVTMNVNRNPNVLNTPLKFQTPHLNISMSPVNTFSQSSFFSTQTLTQSQSFLTDMNRINNTHTHTNSQGQSIHGNPSNENTSWKYWKTPWEGVDILGFPHDTLSSYETVTNMNNNSNNNNNKLVQIFTPSNNLYSTTLLSPTSSSSSSSLYPVHSQETQYTCTSAAAALTSPTSIYDYFGRSDLSNYSTNIQMNPIIYHPYDVYTQSSHNTMFIDGTRTIKYIEDIESTGAGIPYLTYLNDPLKLTRLYHKLVSESSQSHTSSNQRVHTHTQTKSDANTHNSINSLNCIQVYMKQGKKRQHSTHHTIVDDDELNKLLSSDNISMKIQELIKNQYDENELGLLHPEYIILLERCAKYLYTSADLLHYLVLEIENDIFHCLYSRTHAMAEDYQQYKLWYERMHEQYSHIQTELNKANNDHDNEGIMSGDDDDNEYEEEEEEEDEILPTATILTKLNKLNQQQDKNNDMNSLHITTTIDNDHDDYKDNNGKNKKDKENEYEKIMNIYMTWNTLQQQQQQQQQQIKQKNRKSVTDEKSLSTRLKPLRYKTKQNQSMKKENKRDHLYSSEYLSPLLNNYSNMSPIITTTPPTTTTTTTTSRIGILSTMNSDYNHEDPTTSNEDIIHIHTNDDLLWKSTHTCTSNTHNHNLNSDELMMPIANNNNVSDSYYTNRKYSDIMKLRILQMKMNQAVHVNRLNRSSKALKEASLNKKMDDNNDNNENEGEFESNETSSSSSNNDSDDNYDGHDNEEE